MHMNAAHLIQVVDIAAITDTESFKKRMDKAVDYIKGGKKAEGVQEILVPGEPEARTRSKQEAEGVAYAGEVIKENKELAAKYKVADLDTFK
jgi:ureidoglycolate dehydrogenase (NAD+)